MAVPVLGGHGPATPDELATRVGPLVGKRPAPHKSVAAALAEQGDAVHRGLLVRPVKQVPPLHGHVGQRALGTRKRVVEPPVRLLR